jgi:hypothetical protein
MTQGHWSVAKKVFSALVIISIIIAALIGCGPAEPTAPLPTTPTAPGTPTTPPPEETLPPSEPEVPFVPQTILSLTGGDVFIKRAGTDTWVLAGVGTTLQAGDYIKAASGAHAEITFFEGSTIELQGDTQISLSEISLSATGSTTIHLSQYFGETVSRVKQLTDAESSYEIETQAAVAAVRGSTMIVTVEEDGTTTVTNVEGNIWVSAQGTDVAVPEGMQSTTKPGETPGEPEPVEPPEGTPPPSPPHSIVSTGVEAICNDIHCDQVQAGGEILYVYFISNEGDILIPSVELTDNVTGNPELWEGDLNENGILEPGETWIYMAFYNTSCEDPLLLINTATWVITTFYGTTVTAQDHAEVTILHDACF